MARVVPGQVQVLPFAPHLAGVGRGHQQGFFARPRRHQPAAVGRCDAWPPMAHSGAARRPWPSPGAQHRRHAMVAARSSHTGAIGAMPTVNLRAVSVTISASSFGWHDMESYFRPGALSSYSFTADNRIVTNRFERLFKAHIDTIRRHGAQPVLFMSWAYADAPEMTQPLADAHTRAGNDNRALVVPVGLAFARVVQQHPQINLYHTDKRHPSLAGTDLAPAMLHGALYGQSPEGLSHTAGLDADTVRVLQRVGWQTLQDYYKP